MFLTLIAGAVAGYYGKKALDKRNHVLVRKARPTVQEGLKIRARCAMANVRDWWEDFSTRNVKEDK